MRLSYHINFSVNLFFFLVLAIDRSWIALREAFIRYTIAIKEKKQFYIPFKNCWNIVLEDMCNILILILYYSAFTNIKFNILQLLNAFLEIFFIVYPTLWVWLNIYKVPPVPYQIFSRTEVVLNGFNLSMSVSAASNFRILLKIDYPIRDESITIRIGS